MIAGQVTRQAIAAAGDRSLLIRPDGHGTRAPRPPKPRPCFKAAGVSGVVVDAAHVTTLGLIEDFRIDWQWVPAWRPADITDDGREQLRAIGFTI
jgi:hypothetical protein